MDVKAAQTLVRLESARYLGDVGVLENLGNGFTLPVALYILGSFMCLPVKTLIVGERPYSTDIHPSVSSAMSYEPRKSRPTPSTTGIAMDLMSVTGAKHIDTERWIRDGWKHLSSGTLIVNCCIYTPFSSSTSQRDTVPFQRWITSVLKCSMQLSGDKIDVICMGVPAANVMDAALRSMGHSRLGIRKKTCCNPAAVGKPRTGDATSRDRTLGNKEISRSILSAIKRSSLYIPLEAQDYVSCISTTMSHQLPQVNKVLAASSDLAESLESAFKDLEANHKMPQVKDSLDAFNRAIIEYRDSVLIDIVSHTISASTDNSSKIGRPVEWGNKKKWNKTPSSVGNSSKMSTVEENDEGIEQKFEDDDVPEPSKTPEPRDETPVPKKKKVVRRVVRRPSSQATSAGGSKGSSTAGATGSSMGTKISDEMKTDLRTCLYYLSEAHPEQSVSLQESINRSLASDVVENEDVAIVVDTIDMEIRSTGSRPGQSLGIDDGVVSDESKLPRLLATLSTRG